LGPKKDVVEAEIRKRAGNPDITKAQEAAEKARNFFQQKRDDVISILRTAKSDRDDSFLDKLLEDAEKVKAYTFNDFIHYWQPSIGSPAEAL